MLRAFAPVWLVVVLLLFLTIVLPVALTLGLALADVSFKID